MYKITYEKSYCFKKWKIGALEIDIEFIEKIMINGNIYDVKYVEEMFDEGYAKLRWKEPYMLVNVDDMIFEKRLSEAIDEGKEVMLYECL